MIITSKKIKIGLVVCVVLVIVLMFSNAWFFLENDRLVSERDSLKNEVVTLTPLKDEVARLETEEASLIAERDNFKAEVDALVIERDEARTEVETLAGLNRTLSEGVVALTTERDTLKAEAVERENDVYARDREIDNLNGQISDLNQQIDDLNQEIEALEGPNVQESIQVDGWGWIEENEEWVWQERIHGDTVNVGLGDANHVTVTVRWYLDEELVGITEYYYRVLSGGGGSWTIDEYFTFSEQPDRHEIELEWE